MKVRFFTVLTILILIIVGFLLYISLNKDQFTQDKANQAITISPSPTVIPSPTVTPVPADYEAAPGVYPVYQSVNDTMVYGYINKDGLSVIKPSFTSAGDFHDGIAIVTMDNRYLAIDDKGSILYYSDNPIGDFHNGTAIISRNSGENTLYGYINTEGIVILKPQYKLAGDFDANGTAYVYTGSGKYAQIDKNGRVLNNYKINSKLSPSYIADGYVIYTNLKNNYGVINLQGEEIFPAKYINISYLGNQIFALKKADESYFGMYSELPCALFRANGEQITEYNLYDVTPYFNGYASATDDKYTFFIDENGKEVTTLPKYEGRGMVMLFGDVIKAKIDHDLLYSKTEGTIFWQNSSVKALSDTVSVKEIKYKSCRYVLVYYPQIEGLSDSTIQNKINLALQQQFTGTRTKLTAKDKYIVEDTFQATLTKNLLIIERDGYDYSFGAAHGNPIMDYYYIDIITGAFYQLKDLFIKDTNYVKFINDAITADIAADSSNEGMYLKDAFTGIKEDQTFILTPSTLTIYFYPYEIAAYAAGFPKFEIPIEDLYEYIDFHGAFWQSYN